MKTIRVYLATIVMLAFCLCSLNVHASEGVIGKDIISKEYEKIESDRNLINAADELNMDVISFKKEIVSPLDKFRSGIHEKGIEVVNYIVPRDTGDNYRETSIVYYSAKVYSRIYYDTIYKNNVEFARLKSAEGGIKDFNSGFYLVKQNVILCTYGSYDGAPYHNQRVEYSTTNKTWSYNAPTWNHVSMGGSHTIGVTINATIKHGGSAYTGTASNVI